MHQVFLGIGGNIGNKSENFKNISVHIENLPGKILAVSSVYESPAWGFNSENKFWNQVYIIQTHLSPFDLLHKNHKIENHFGRKKGNSGYADREMDIDILYYDDEILETENLIIPHPKIQHRKFVLVPLAEIAPNHKHPLLRFNSTEMLDYCKDASLIKKIDLYK